ncbi:glycosyltransferase family 4 protein [Cylindrospermopsis raciborskii G7]|uniref:glycosyltransferase family 4 protein n=1 Tax=Cylindrospermopsis raciborskii TaxID=77022 RepID=UPI003EBA9E8B
MNYIVNHQQKIAVLFANYGPYHVARVASAYHAGKSRGWNVCGIELARTEKEYPWKTQLDEIPFPIYSAITDIPLETVKLIGLLSKLTSVLDQANPDAIAISGYARPAMLVALLWCLFHRKTAILLSETTENDEPRSWWKEKIKQFLVSKYQAALVGGNPQKRYLIKLGMRADAIFLGHNVVGNEVFYPDNIKSLPSPLNKPFFLCINRFVNKKNLPFLLSAYVNYRKLVGDKSCDLVLCGDGELRAHLEQQITNQAIKDYVHLPGFLQQQEILPYFAHASCFIHASIQEQWGLVVNEAMAAGLPVLVSNRCGCYEDLIIEGINGFGFDPENVQQLTELMCKISSGEVNLAEMGKAALAHIQKFSPEYFAQGLLQAVEFSRKGS